MKKDFVSLTPTELAKIKPQVVFVSWKSEDGDNGPIWINLGNGTSMAYQQSRFNSADAKWFTRLKAKTIADELKAPLKTF